MDPNLLCVQKTLIEMEVKVHFTCMCYDTLVVCMENFEDVMANVSPVSGRRRKMAQKAHEAIAMWRVRVFSTPTFQIKTKNSQKCKQLK
jgi:hypothetical protein